jgi:hypothetical protein
VSLLIVMSRGLGFRLAAEPKEGTRGDIPLAAAPFGLLVIRRRLVDVDKYFSVWSDVLGECVRVTSDRLFDNTGFAGMGRGALLPVLPKEDDMRAVELR